MPVKIPDSTKQIAIRMRKENKTYHEISEFTGLSTRWCKTHLKDVVSDYEKKIEELCIKSKTPSAITKTEIIKTLEISGGRKTVLSKTKDTVKKIKSKDKDNLVRPAWMHPCAPMVTTNGIFSIIEALEDRLNEMSIELHNQILHTLPECLADTAPSVNSLKQITSALLAATQANDAGASEKLMRWFNSINSVSVELSKINPPEQLEHLCVFNTVTQSFIDETEVPY